MHDQDWAFSFFKSFKRNFKDKAAGKPVLLVRNSQFFLQKWELELYKFLTAVSEDVNEQRLRTPQSLIFYCIQFFSLPVDAAGKKELSTTEFLTNLLAFSKTHL